MCIRRLVPRPKTTVTDLGARQVHTHTVYENVSLPAHSWHCLFLRVVVSKAYAMHTT